jgi:hypothetical protein
MKVEIQGIRKFMTCFALAGAVLVLRANKALRGSKSPMYRVTIGPEHSVHSSGFRQDSQLRYTLIPTT